MLITNLRQGQRLIIGDAIVSLAAPKEQRGGQFVTLTIDAPKEVRVKTEAEPLKTAGGQT